MQFGQLKRRGFITLFVGALAWPLSASAQQSSKAYRVGWFYCCVSLTEMAGSDPVDPVGKAFVGGLRTLGYVEPQNLVLLRRSAERKLERLPEIAKELVGQIPDVIITGGGDITAQALSAVTKTVPIVAPYMDNPIGLGLAASLSHPGGNVTGFTQYTGLEFEGKRLQLLKEAIPTAKRIAFLATKEVWEGRREQQLRDAATTLGLTLIHVEHSADDYKDAFDAMSRDPPDALFVGFHATNYANRQLIADFALAQRIPAIFPTPEGAEAGGLMSYAVSGTDLYRRAAGLVDKILKGIKPADIPIEQPTKFEFLINLKTAKAFGLEIPPRLLALADKVVE
jgi:putative ABC transport system substrate-binding protein